MVLVQGQEPAYKLLQYIPTNTICEVIKFKEVYVNKRYSSLVIKS